MKSGLSLCMIIKDEEACIERALRSFQGVADEIIVGDTGSTDKSADICKQFGAKVIAVAWNDDFSKARNKVLKAASCKWIFVLDADEYLKEGDGKLLAEESQIENVCGFFVPFEDLDDNGCVKTFSLPRFFLNRPDIRFSNPIHESVVRDLEQLTENSGMKIQRSRASLVHTGYQSSVIRNREKLSRNLGILEKAYEKNPEDLFLLLKYGDNLRLLERDEDALRIFHEGISFWAQHPPHSLSKGTLSGVIPEIFAGAVTLLIKQSRLKEAEDLCRQCAEQFQHISIYYNLGIISWKNGELEKAINFFKQAENCKSKGMEDPYGAYPYALNAIGEICFKKKNLEESELYFGRARDSAPGLVNPWVNSSLLSVEKGDLKGAISYMEKAHQIAPENALVNKTRALLLNFQKKQG